MPRIGVLTTSHPRFDGDVAGAFVHDLSVALAARGHALEVLAPEPRRGAPPPRAGGVSVRWVPYVRPRALARTFYGAGVLDNLARDPLAWVGLAPFVAALTAHARRRVHGWDAILSHWAVPTALVAGAVRGERPHAAVLHSADVHVIERLPRALGLASRVARAADALWFASGDLRERFLARLDARAAAAVRGRTHVGVVGVHRPDLPPRQAARARLALAPDEPVLLTLARLVPIKGVDLAVRAAAATGATLLVAGDGPHRRALEGLARRLGARARFLGWVCGAAKRDALAAADVFLAPSRPLASGRTEGAPVAVLEALAAGLPVVAACTGGLPELVPPEAGRLVPPDDPTRLAAAVGGLLAAPDLRAALARGARDRAAAHGWAAVAARVERALFG